MLRRGGRSVLYGCSGMNVGMLAALLSAISGAGGSDFSFAHAQSSADTDSCDPAAAAGACSGNSGESRRICEDFYANLPDRRAFFQRVQPPPGVPAERFGQLLAKGGIHPRGVILASEFYELPLVINSSRLQEEVDALLAAAEWESASPGNAAQGVVSKHLRLTRGVGDLVGPFQEDSGRLAKSPYIRLLLASLGGVIGNTALMSLEPNGTVEAHFDTNDYWHARVRVHIPVRTNKKVWFSCGQKDEMQTLNMRVGRAYLFDNHLGHSVENKGKSTRIHLTVDLVGNGRFWELVKRSIKHGSTKKKGRGTKQEMSEAKDAKVATEVWNDEALQSGCRAVSEAIVSTASQLGLGTAAERVTSAWCPSGDGAAAGAPRRSRREDIGELRRLAVEQSCEANPASHLSPGPGLVEVVESVVELHRLAEADAELNAIGGEEVK
mmetsp:Transcript_131639/g.421126  ORF Transcript_131639/g.421126 Transcript_131639/m.421126 type:complete len:438 (+) Transcript_131639:87-1400(+)